MKTSKKIIFILVVSLLTLILNPIFSHATTYSATSEDTLTQAVETATNGDIINLSNNISLTKPLEIKEKNITINGNGHTISKDANTFEPNGANATLITAGQQSTVTLMNLSLENSQKYGAQAYDGGYLIVDNVTISNCAYGGILVNAGTLEVRNLDLKHNGREDSNNGIEIGKSEAISDHPNDPVLKMNGTLTSTETENVVYVAINDKLADFEVENDENTTNKILLNGNQLVITDENNNILYSSNPIEKEEINIESPTYAKNVYLTINLLDKTVTITTQEDRALSEEEVKSQINLQTLGLANYSLDGFFSDKDLLTKVAFPRTFTEDVSIYAKLTPIPTQTPEQTQPEQPAQQEQPQVQDETPKTGVDNLVSIALLGIAVSIIAVVALKKEF